jgi:HK97 family phage prohead protease
MIERRSYQGNIAETNGKLRGLASPTYDGTPGTQYELFDGVVERFAPGAFDDHLKTSPDVVALYNHDPSIVLGRTPNTLRLQADATGLHYEVDLPDTTAARDLKVSVSRGDIKGSSFAFVPTDVEWTQDGNTDVRLIRGAKVFDVSPVTKPAYGGSSVGLRSDDERRAIEKERDEYKAKINTEKWISKIHSLKNVGWVDTYGAGSQVNHN